MKIPFDLYYTDLPKELTTFVMPLSDLRLLRGDCLSLEEQHDDDILLSLVAADSFSVVPAGC